jgi:hypothetical protein
MNKQKLMQDQMEQMQAQMAMMPPMPPEQPGGATKGAPPKQPPQPNAGVQMTEGQNVPTIQ